MLALALAVLIAAVAAAPTKSRPFALPKAPFAIPTSTINFNDHLLTYDYPKAPLYFDSQGNFKMLVVSDMHDGYRDRALDYDAVANAADNLTQQLHGAFMDFEKPNMVFYNGDIVNGESLFKENATNFVDRRKLPWSSGYGNHENAFNITHNEIINYEMSRYGGVNGLSYSHSEAGAAPYGTGNNILLIYPSKPNLLRRALFKLGLGRRQNYGKPALVVMTLDSRQHEVNPQDPPFPFGADSWVDPDTVPKWIRGQTQIMRQQWNTLPPFIVFVHIPFDYCEQLELIPGLIGNQDEGCSGQGYDQDGYGTYHGYEPTVAELRVIDDERGNIIAINSGHDHGNQWCARSTNSSGLMMCYSGHSGFEGYTTPNSVQRNGRVYNFNLADLARPQGPQADTWILWENLTRADQLTLNGGFMAAYN